MTRELQGILWILISCVFMASMTAIVRHMAIFHLSSVEVVFMRNFISVALLLGIVGLKKEKPTLKILDVKTYFYRVTVGMTAMIIWFYALTKLPLATATALSFSTPIFASVAAVIFLGEKMGVRRWGAVIAGFVGTMIIIRPGIAVVDPAALYVLGSCFLMSIALVLVKKMSKTEQPFSMLFHMHLWMAVFSLPIALFIWEAPSLDAWLWASLLAVFSTAGHYTLIKSYSLVDISLTLPFDFTRLIIASIIGYFAFSEIPDRWSYIGAAVIVGSAVYIAHREAMKKRQIKTPRKN